MDEKNDLFDELNWYTGDFDVPAEKPKKEKKHAKSSHSRRERKEDERSRIFTDSSKYTGSSSFSDFVKTKSRKDKLDSLERSKIEKRTVRSREKNVQRSRETVSAESPVRKSARVEKPDIKLYQRPEIKTVKSDYKVYKIEKPKNKTLFNTEKSEAPRVIKMVKSETRSYKIEKPEIKFYEPVKSVVKSKDLYSIVNQPLSKNIQKNVDIVSKSEVQKVAEPMSHFIKTHLSSSVIKTLSDKLALLEERDKLIRSSQEKPSTLKQAHAIKGTCPDMCPEKERIMRSLKKMVSVFECSNNSTEMDPMLAVKEYARSSADQEEPLPHELRPEPVLTMSMSYIITRIITLFEECEDVSAWYDFCWNRLRAIRKDIVQQQLCDLDTVTIVEQCARFHIVCFDRFWGMDSSIFDEKINTENLMNCLKILLNLYGDLRKQGVICPNEPEFNAYMILIKMNSGDILWEFLNFPLSLQQTPEVIEAVKIHMFYNSNMYSQFFNHLLKTSYLNTCLMQRCFTQLRVRALEAIVKAYCPPNKEGKVSLQHIMRSLKFDTKDDTLAFCKSCNIYYTERVGFKIFHSRFSRPENLVKAKTPSSLVCNKRVDFAQAVVGVNNDLPVYFEHSVHNSFLDDKTLQADALDASDQEEKMLRDNVQRKLLLKTFKKTPTKASQNDSTSTPSTPVLQRSLSFQSNRKLSVESNASSKRPMEKQLDVAFPEEPDDVEMEEEMSESEDYDMPEVLEQFPDKDEKEEFNSAHGDEVDGLFLNALIENNVESSDYEVQLEAALEYQPISPLSVISDKSAEVEEIIEEVDDIEKEEEEVEREEEDEEESEEEEEEIFGEQSGSPGHLSPPNPPSLASTSKRVPTFNIPLIKISDSSTNYKPSERRLSVSSLKEEKSNQITSKLRSKLKINFQRISAKKYGRIWREKVKEIKKSYGFIPLVSHMNMKQYLNVWGRSSTKHSNILNQLNNTKKLCSSVDSLLLFNMFDTSLKRMGQQICETLVDKKLKMNRLIENQIGPIYWKLVLSLPSSKVSSHDLYEEVSSWSQQVFFSSEVARKTGIETQVFKGIKVHCKVTVLEGCEKLDASKNMSALVMMNVPGWESSNDSQNRLSRLTSLVNHPIPVYVVNLAPFQSSLVAPSEQSVSFYKELTASTSTDLAKIIKELAFNSYQLCVKSLHMCDLMNEMLDKFLDALQEDCYNNSAFLSFMSDPTNILHLYNSLILMIKKEIVHIYKSNIFGTANEIILTITPNSKYSHSICNILEDYLDSLTMSKLQWPPSNSSTLLLSLKNYCEKSGIPQVLSHVIRMINPPDDDDTEQALSDFLDQLNWLRIMEVVIKAHFRTKFCDVIVTYSDKSMNSLIDTHWWMDFPLVS